MNENIEYIENIAKIEATGFQDLCNYIRELETKNKELENENKQLKSENKLLGSELTYFKEYSADLEDENHKRILESNRLFGELYDIKHMSMFEFANKYCSSESLEADGHAFARALGVGMSDEDIQIENGETGYKPYTAGDF